MFATPPAGRPRAINRHNQQLFDQLFGAQQNLTLDGKRALKILLSANKQLNTAYVLKESFGQLWGYEREGWARRFFENRGGPQVAAAQILREIRRDERPSPA
jgi:hypothetical protein